MKHIDWTTFYLKKETIDTDLIVSDAKIFITKNCEKLDLRPQEPNFKYFVSIF